MFSGGKKKIPFLCIHVSRHECPFRRSKYIAHCTLHTTPHEIETNAASTDLFEANIGLSNVQYTRKQLRKKQKPIKIRFAQSINEFVEDKFRGVYVHLPITFNARFRLQ